MLIRKPFHPVLFLSLLLMGGCSIAPLPPVADRVDTALVMHGDTRIDPYFWLCKRDSQPVLDYLLAENAYTDAMMESTHELQETLFNEFASRRQQREETTPVYLNGYYYYIRYEAGKEYPINCRKKGSLDAPEEIILDENEVAAGYRYCQVASIDISPDNRYLAFGLDTSGTRLFDVYFKDLQTGLMLNVRIPRTTGAIAWANDSRTVFFSQKDRRLRPAAIYRLNILQSQKPPVPIYRERDSTFSVHVFPSKSGRYIFIASNGNNTSEYRFLCADNPNSTCRLIQPRIPDVEYSVEHAGNNFYILTNWKAQNFRLMQASITVPDTSTWVEIIPHRKDVLILNIDPFKDFLVVTERKDALLKVNVINLKDGSSHYVDFGEEVYTALPSVNPDFNSKNFLYYYTSLTTPATTFQYDMVSNQKRKVKQLEVVGGYDPANYITKRLWAVSHDGTRVPISIVYRKGIKLNGKNPLVLYGYGAYGYSINPNFDPNLLSLLDRGVIYAIAHVRGGQELGRIWYDQGRLLNKKNTFFDFIACTRLLIDQGYSSPGHIVAQGSSAGGLLMGVVANMHPELYCGIVAEVPFVDVLTSMLNPDQPLTTGEYDEWGNPADSTFYFYIKSYSPYDQVAGQDYPNMLVLASYNDSQVQYFEPAKWVAKLRRYKTDNNLLLLQVDMDAGHKGNSGRNSYLRQQAFVYAFILKVLEIDS